MHRLAAIVVAITATLPLSAQRFGGGTNSGINNGTVVYRNGFGTPQTAPGAGLNGLPGIRSTVPGTGLNGISSSVVRQSRGNCLNCGIGHGGRGRGHGGVYPPILPIFGGYSFPTSFSGDEGAVDLPPVDPNAIAITDEVDRLRGEVDQLKAQAGANTPLRPPQPAAPPAATEPAAPPEPATVIVLTSGKRVESTNYAVMNDTLWNFSAKPLQKIPISNIDMAASEKANAERGVEFSLATNATR